MRKGGHCNSTFAATYSNQKTYVLRSEIAELLSLKSKYGPGGEYEPDWRPPGPPPSEGMGGPGPGGPGGFPPGPPPVTPKLLVFVLDGKAALPNSQQ